MILIEKDCDLIDNLKSKFREHENSSILNIDILNYNIDSLDQSVRVVGNLPYNISTEIIFKMCNCTKIIDMHFMLQKEFAERCAGNENSKSYGKLSVICDYLFEVSILKDVDKSFFIPPPKVDSAFVRFKPKRKTFNEIEFVNLKKILNLLFNAKRKKIKKTLLSLFSEKDLESTGINLNLRPDELNTASFIKLSKLIKNNG
jgi:16S rRNA (adenine1518-N6/adenine1519-N6)-dimethyltransferase